MSEKTAEKKGKSPKLERSFLKELKLEFGKISWSDSKSVFRQSVVVIISAIVMGLVIAGVDYLLSVGLSFILV